MFFLTKGYRVIAHDRRGHGRSSQAANGHDMDTYAADVAELTAHLNLQGAVHIGHSTGGGEAIHYAARAEPGRVAKVVLVSAVTPLMVQGPTNPDGVPMSVFDEIREGTATNRAQYFLDFSIPFYGFNREGANVKQGLRDNWFRQGMSGGANAHYYGIAAFSETDFSEDLKSVDLPVLVLHGEDDQIVPFQVAAAKAIKLLKHGKLIAYPGFPHGMPATEAATINADLLAFIQE